MPELDFTNNTCQIASMSLIMSCLVKMPSASTEEPWPVQWKHLVKLNVGAGQVSHPCIRMLDTAPGSWDHPRKHHVVAKLCLMPCKSLQLLSYAHAWLNIRQN